jgi:hypothetical protein
MKSMKSIKRINILNVDAFSYQKWNYEIFLILYYVREKSVHLKCWILYIYIYMLIYFSKGVKKETITTLWHGLGIGIGIGIVSLHSITLHYIPLHYITFHFISFHFCISISISIRISRNSSKEATVTIVKQQEYK